MVEDRRTMISGRAVGANPKTDMGMGVEIVTLSNVCMVVEMILS